jgi:hypothetical protein
MFRTAGFTLVVRRRTEPVRAALLAAVLATTAAPAPAQSPEMLVAEAREIAGRYALRLQSALQEAMASAGPESAITTCRIEAPAIAESLSDGGWQVRRTAVRVRNESNAPDAFERERLADFIKRLESGESLQDLESWQSSVSGENREFRFMKAIGTAELCLTCHGSPIAAGIAAKLDELYPDDAARGFRAGEIRGAFSLTRRWRSTENDE